MSSFVKNSFITFGARVITATFTVVITVIIARALGPRGQGIYSVAVLFPSLLLIFMSFGLNSGAVCYFISKKKYPVKQILGTSLILNFFIGIFIILVGLGIIFLGGEIFFPGIEKIYLVLSLFLVPLFLFTPLGLNVLLGLYEIKNYNIISVFQNALFFIFVVIFLSIMKFGVTVTILSQVFSYIVNIIILFFIILKKTKGVDFKLNIEYLKESFLYGVKNHLVGIFDFLHSRIDLFLINFFTNPFSAGIYFASVRLAEGVWLFSSSIGTVLFPKVASEEDPQKLKEFTPLVCRNVLFLSLLITAVLFLLSGWLINFLYSSEFSGAIVSFRILLIGILAACGYGILSSDLAARGKPMLNAYAIGISVLLNIFLNIIWIPKWGIDGAALATTVSYTIMFFIAVVFYVKLSGNKIKDTIFIKKDDFKFYGEITNRVFGKR